MARSKTPRRHIEPDFKYKSVKVARLINYVMHSGKKALAVNIVYRSFDIIREKTGMEPLEVFQKSEENVAPRVLVASRRIGGANISVPKEITPEKQFQFFLRWMVEATRERRERTMVEKLANEFIEASKGEGNAMKKKLNMDKSAHAHRAYAHLK